MNSETYFEIHSDRLLDRHRDTPRHIPSSTPRRPQANSRDILRDVCCDLPDNHASDLVKYMNELADILAGDGDLASRMLTIEEYLDSIQGYDVLSLRDLHLDIKDALRDRTDLDEELRESIMDYADRVYNDLGYTRLLDEVSHAFYEWYHLNWPRTVSIPYTRITRGVVEGFPDYPWEWNWEHSERDGSLRGYEVVRNVKHLESLLNLLTQS